MKTLFQHHNVIHQDRFTAFKKSTKRLHSTFHIDSSKPKHLITARHVSSFLGTATSILTVALNALAMLEQSYTVSNKLTSLCTPANANILSATTTASNSLISLIDAKLVSASDKPQMWSGLAADAGLAVTSFANMAKPLAASLIGATSTGKWVGYALDASSEVSKVIGAIRPILRSQVFVDAEKLVFGKI